jgi:hypothetical protein
MTVSARGTAVRKSPLLVAEGQEIVTNFNIARADAN